MKWTVLSLFPEMFVPFNQSILKRAKDAGKITIDVINFRKYSADKHKKTDDYSFSPEAGLILSCQPIYDCVNAIDPKHKAWRIFMTPAAPVLTQKKVIELSKYEHILILCGHYEGVDQRVIDLCFDEVLSIGNYVLTGGEIPAMAVVDAVSRCVDGVIRKESLIDESFCRDGYLEPPKYTRPREFVGLSVPKVLLSGNHAEIKKWKKNASAEVIQKYKA